MSNLVTIRFPYQMLEELDRLSRCLGITRTDCILNAIQLHAQILATAAAAPQGETHGPKPAERN
jgi:hypothetical protein